MTTNPVPSADKPTTSVPTESKSPEDKSLESKKNKFLHYLNSLRTQKNSEMNEDILFVRKVIESFNKKSEELDKENITNDKQVELSKLIVLLQIIERLIYKYRKNPSKRKELIILVNYLDIALKSVFQTQPNMELANQIRIDIKKVVYRYEHNQLIGFLINRFDEAKRSKSIPIMVLYGLIFSSGVCIGLAGIILLSNSLWSIGLNTFNISIPDNMSNLIKRLEDREIPEVSGKIDKADQALKDLSSAPNNQSPSSEKMSDKIFNKTIELKSLSSQRTKLEEQLASFKKQQLYREVENQDLLRQVVFVLIAGTFGSIISILTRIEEFPKKEFNDPIMPFLIGAFKPIIGTLSALFIFTLIRSDLIAVPNITIPDPAKQSSNLEFANRDIDGRKMFFIFAISFVVGFSERIAKDAIEKVEGHNTGDSER